MCLETTAHRFGHNNAIIRSTAKKTIEIRPFIIILMKKIISLQIGQCGNQIGYKFWRRLALEHGIAPDGVLTKPDDNVEDRKDIFFYQADDGRYVPRSILIDLEERVIGQIKGSEYNRFYNPENVLVYSGGGAGNVWAKGYDIGLENYENIADVVRREVEFADALEGFVFCHSIAGGTGSGIGSLLLERLTDEYGKATTMTFSVFPDPTASDVNVQPHNSILTIQRLAEKADAVIVLDNAALYQISETKLNKPRNTDEARDAVNDLVSLVMAATTTTLRFPSYSNNDMVSLFAPLIPIPQCHFLMTGYTPLTLLTSHQVVRKTSVIDVMNRLLDPKNVMVSAHMDTGMFISILNIIQGEVDPSEIQRALGQIRENRSLRFIPWGPASVQLALSRKSPYVETPNRVSGLMLANHTNIRSLIDTVAKQLTQMLKKGAHLHSYEAMKCMGKDAKAQFERSLEYAREVSEEYAAAEKANFGSFE
jgi:tubulin gamma